MTHRLRRRDFITLLGGAAAAWPLAAKGQQPGAMRRIGVLMAYADNDSEYQTFLGGFREGLQKLGWAEGRNLRIDTRWATSDAELIQRHAIELVAAQPELILSSSTPTTAALLQQTRTIPRGLGELGFAEGRNVAIEYRWADGQFDRMPAMAADLIARKVAVILVGGNLAGVQAVTAATQTIPIVFTTTTDPVEYGLVASLNRPRGNVTGVTSMATELLPKLLELLHEAIPAARKFALLANPNNPVTVQGSIEAAQMETFLVRADEVIE